MEILAAYDLTHSYRDAAELVGCAPNTVVRYVLARDAGGLKTTPAQRTQLIDQFREKVEEWVDASHGRIRADVAQRKLEAMGYDGSERTTRRAVAESGLSSWPSTAISALAAGTRTMVPVGLRRRAAGGRSEDEFVLRLVGVE